MGDKGLILINEDDFNVDLVFGKTESAEILADAVIVAAKKMNASPGIKTKDERDLYQATMKAIQKSRKFIKDEKLLRTKILKALPKIIDSNAKICLDKIEAFERGYGKELAKWKKHQLVKKNISKFEDEGHELNVKFDEEKLLRAAEEERVIKLEAENKRLNEERIKKDIEEKAAENERQKLAEKEASVIREKRRLEEQKNSQEREIRLMKEREEKAKIDEEKRIEEVRLKAIDDQKKAVAEAIIEANLKAKAEKEFLEAEKKKKREEEEKKSADEEHRKQVRLSVFRSMREDDLFSAEEAKKFIKFVREGKANGISFDY